MLRFIKGFAGTGILMLLLLTLGIAYSTIKDGTSMENSSLLFTLGLSFMLPLYAVLGTIGGVLWMWRSPGGRFSGVISHGKRLWGKNNKSWIYDKVRIGGRDVGTAVLPDTLDRMWQETKNYGQQAEVFKMGRVIVAIRSPKGSGKEWNLEAMRAAYPITCNLMMVAVFLGGAGLLWLLPIYFWGSIRANQVLKGSKQLSQGWEGARL